MCVLCILDSSLLPIFGDLEPMLISFLNQLICCPSMGSGCASRMMSYHPADISDSAVAGGAIPVVFGIKYVRGFINSPAQVLVCLHSWTVGSSAAVLSACDHQSHITVIMLFTNVALLDSLHSPVDTCWHVLLWIHVGMFSCGYMFACCPVDTCWHVLLWIHVGILPCGYMLACCPVDTCLHVALWIHVGMLPCGYMFACCPVDTCLHVALWIHVCMLPCGYMLACCPVDTCWHVALWIHVGMLPRVLKHHTVTCTHIARYAN